MPLSRIGTMNEDACQKMDEWSLSFIEKIGLTKALSDDVRMIGPTLALQGALRGNEDLEKQHMKEFIRVLNRTAGTKGASTVWKSTGNLRGLYDVGNQLGRW